MQIIVFVIMLLSRKISNTKVRKALYIVAILVFGNRMFTNFAIIRKYLLNKFKKHDNI